MHVVGSALRLAPWPQGRRRVPVPESVAQPRPSRRRLPKSTAVTMSLVGRVAEQSPYERDGEDLASPLVQHDKMTVSALLLKPNPSGLSFAVRQTLIIGCHLLLGNTFAIDDH